MDNTTETSPNISEAPLFFLDPLSEHLYLPPIFTILGLVGNFWMVVNLCTSVRLRDNLCSKYLCHLTYFETAKMLMCMLNFWGIGLTGRSVLNSHERACTLMVTFVNGIDLCSTWHLLMLSLIRAVHMYNPSWLSSQRSSVTHYSITILVVGIIVSFILIVHADLYRDLHFGSPGHFSTLSPELENTARWTVVKGLVRECQASFIDLMGIDSFSTMMLVMLDMLLIAMVVFEKKMPDNHESIYRHYKALNWVIIVRGLTFIATHGLPRILVNRIHETISPEAYTTYQYISLMDSTMPHWILICCVKTYRKESFNAGCRYIKSKPPLDEHFSSYSDIIQQEVDPEFSSSHGDLLRQHANSF